MATFLSAKRRRETSSSSVARIGVLYYTVHTVRSLPSLVGGLYRDSLCLRVDLEYRSFVAGAALACGSVEVSRDAENQPGVGIGPVQTLAAEIMQNGFGPIAGGGWRQLEYCALT